MRKTLKDNFYRLPLLVDIIFAVTYKKEGSNSFGIRPRMIKMILPTDSSFIFAAIIAIIIIVIGIVLITGSSNPQDFMASKMGRAGALIALLSIVFVIVFAVLFCHNVPYGDIGLDKEGNWYLEGNHFVIPGMDITNIPLTGSVVLSDTVELRYSLAPQEVISMERGGNFPEYLKQEIIVIHEKWNTNLENVPKGIDPSHLKLVIGFNPSFVLIENINIPVPIFFIIFCGTIKARSVISFFDIN